MTALLRILALVSVVAFVSAAPSNPFAHHLHVEAVQTQLQARFPEMKESFGSVAEAFAFNPFDSNSYRLLDESSDAQAIQDCGNSLSGSVSTDCSSSFDEIGNIYSGTTVPTEAQTAQFCNTCYPQLTAALNQLFSCLESKGVVPATSETVKTLAKTFDMVDTYLKILCTKDDDGSYCATKMADVVKETSSASSNDIETVTTAQLDKLCGKCMRMLLKAMFDYQVEYGSSTEVGSAQKGMNGYQAACTKSPKGNYCATVFTKDGKNDIPLENGPTGDPTGTQITGWCESEKRICMTKILGVLNPLGKEATTTAEKAEAEKAREIAMVLKYMCDKDATYGGCVATAKTAYDASYSTTCSDSDIASLFWTASSSSSSSTTAAPGLQLLDSHCDTECKAWLKDVPACCINSIGSFLALFHDKNPMNLNRENLGTCLGKTIPTTTCFSTAEKATKIKTFNYEGQTKAFYEALVTGDAYCEFRKKLLSDVISATGLSEDLVDIDEITIDGEVQTLPTNCGSISDSSVTSAPSSIRLVASSKMEVKVKMEAEQGSDGETELEQASNDLDAAPMTQSSQDAGGAPVESSSSTSSSSATSITAFIVGAALLIAAA